MARRAFRVTVQSRKDGREDFSNEKAEKKDLTKGRQKPPEDQKAIIHVRMKRKKRFRAFLVSRFISIVINKKELLRRVRRKRCHRSLSEEEDPEEEEEEELIRT